MPAEVTWRSPTPPHLHQWNFKWWRRGYNPEQILHRNVLLEAGLGTGKTLSAIEEILELLEYRPCAQILVLARSSNLRTVWADQLREHAPGLAFTILDGPRSLRKALMEVDRYLDQEAHVWVHSHQDLPAMGKSLNYQWDMIVIDECAAFRTAGAQRTSFLVGRKNPKTKEWSAKLDAEFKLAMSGLPMIKQVADLYPILRWLEAWKEDKAAFLERFIELDQYGREKSIKDPAGLIELLRSVRFQVPKSSVLKIPRTWRYDRVELPGWQRDSYKRIQKELKTQWTDPATKQIVQADVASRLSELLRLAQVAAGFEAISNDRWTWHDENAKTKQLLDVVMPELEGEKVILWGAFIPEVQSLTRLLCAAGRRAVSFYGSGPERDEANAASYETWKSGKADVFVSTLAKGAHGLNLPEASAMIFHSSNFDTELRVQALERNYRLTTKHSTLRVVIIEAQNTIDQHISAVLGDDLRKAASLTSLDLQEVLGQ